MRCASAPANWRESSTRAAGSNASGTSPPLSRCSRRFATIALPRRAISIPSAGCWSPRDARPGPSGTTTRCTGSARWSAPGGSYGIRTPTPSEAAAADVGPRAVAPRKLSATHQARHGGHQLVLELLGLLVGGCPPDHAVRRVVIEQAEGHLVERCLDGGDLGDHVDAVAVVFDHPLYTPHLPLNTAQAVQQWALPCGVAV